MSSSSPVSGVSAKRFYGACRFGQMHVYAAQPAAGAGDKTALVCFHSSPLSGVEFRLFQCRMATDRIVLCPDTPGFGGSDVPPRVPTIPDYAGAMADMLEDAGYGPKGRGAVDLLGTHTGTLIATELACARPDLVRNVILSSIALFSDAQRADMRQRYGGPQPLLTDPGFVPKAFQESVIAGHADQTAERRLAFFAERLRAGTTSWYGPEASLSYDPIPRLKTMAQPVLLLVVRDILAQNTRDAMAFVPKVTLKDLEAVTTNAPWDAQADLLAATVRGYLDEA
jgi:pimeloyl-ACP methyl ester carboxylesterase